MTLLSNALDFVASAGEYINSRADTEVEEKRHVKYAVLHLVGGVELLLMERLRREDWSLIFDNPDEATEDKLASGDFQSLRWKSLVERLEEVTKKTLPRDTRALLESLRRIRHRFQHFEYNSSLETAQSLIHRFS